jgi:uncharacterized phage protein gp47/JayE
MASLVFPIPSLETCVQNARSAFAAQLPGLNAWLWPNNIGPTAKVIGGESWNLFNRLDFVGSQAFALFAVGKYLDFHGSEINIIRKTATPAVGNVVITTTAALSVSGNPPAQFQRGDGVIFFASAAASINGAGNLSVPVIGPAALSSNTQAGAPMTIVAGVSGPGASLAPTVAVDSNGLSGGNDVEADGPPKTSDLSTYRGRILFRKRNPPMGGAPADFVVWAGAVQGVTRVFVEPLFAGPGTVRIFPLFDGLFPGGVPDAAHIALVTAPLDLVQPAAASVAVVAATPQPISITIANLNPPTSAAQAAVTAEINDTFQRLGQVAGIAQPNPALPFLATPFTFLALWAEQAVANAEGVIGADVTVADTVIATASVPVPSVTFV